MIETLPQQAPARPLCDVCARRLTRRTPTALMCYSGISLALCGPCTRVCIDFDQAHGYLAGDPAEIRAWARDHITGFASRRHR